MLATITNTDENEITIDAGTIFTDSSLNKQWELLSNITLSRTEQINVTLYSVDKEDISINAGTAFTHTEDFSITVLFA